MKHYRIASESLKVRATPDKTGAVIEKLPKNAEFFSTQEAPGEYNSSQIWAKRTTGGFLCIKDKAYRYCEEIPMPTPEPDAGPTSPLLAEIGSLRKRVAELERKVEILGSFVAAHKDG